MSLTMTFAPRLLIAAMHAFVDVGGAESQTPVAAAAGAASSRSETAEGKARSLARFTDDLRGAGAGAEARDGRGRVSILPGGRRRFCWYDRGMVAPRRPH